MENKTIKIFISSSCELSAEREALAGFATEVNNIWCDKGITVIPVEWEFVESGLNGGSKQKEYNQEIDECMRCVVMFATKVGKYTKKELNYALRRAKKGENPKRVNVLFKCGDFIELEKYPDVKGVYDDLMAKEMFPEKFNNFTINNFNTMDSLKLKFLTYIQFELKQYFADIDLKIEDGKVTMGGKTFFEYGNLPSFKNCEEYQNLLKHITDKKELLLYSKDETTRLRHSSELNELLKKKANMEKTIWDVTLELTRMSSDRCTKKQRQAIGFMENGRYKEALALLPEEEIDLEVRDNQKRVKIGNEGLTGLKNNIKDYNIRIDALKSMMENGWVEKVIGLYRKILNAAKEYIEEYELAKLLYEYAKFLQKENQFHLAESPFSDALEKYRKLAETNPSEYLPDVADTLNNLGLLHWDNYNRYDNAEKELKEALGIYRKLTAVNPAVYRPHVAAILNNLSGLHSNNNRYEEAEEELKESFEICREQAATNPAYLPNVIMTLHNLGILHSDNNRYEEAEKELKESLEMWQELAAINLAEYRPRVAMILYNLGNLYRKNNRYEEAEKEYNEALEIRMELAKANPAAYLPDVAITLNNLGNLHIYNNRYGDAENELVKALEMYRKLAADNPFAYLPHVAMVLNNLGNLHYYINNRFHDAEEEYKEALGIKRELAKANAAAYLPDVAMVLNNLGLLHYMNNRYDDAEKEFNKAFEIYRDLAETNHDAYCSKVVH